MQDSKPKLLFIVNPVAGKSLLRTQLMRILEMFQKNGWETTVRITLSSEDAEKYAADSGSFDRIICAGGDGTLSEVVNGLVHSNSDLPLGYIPCGTTNDFANTLGLPKNMFKAAEFALLGEADAYDVGEFNGRCFTYTAAFGLFSDVSYITPQKIKNTLGRAAYLLNGAEKVLNVKAQHLTITCDGKRIPENEFLFGMISNSKSVGGFKGLGGIETDLSDGMFEYVFVKMPKNPLELQLVLKAFVQHELLPENGVYYAKCHNVIIESPDRIPWTIDGDFGGNPEKGELTVLPGRVKYIANDRNK